MEVEDSHTSPPHETPPKPLIDLGSDYYILKFTNPENMNPVLSNGPWFLYRHYLSIQKWVPNFVPENFVLTESVVWILPPMLSSQNQLFGFFFHISLLNIMIVSYCKK